MLLYAQMVPGQECPLQPEMAIPGMGKERTMTTQTEMTWKEIHELGESFVSGLENLTKARAELKNVVTALIALAERDIKKLSSQDISHYNNLPFSSWMFGGFKGEYYVRWQGYDVYIHSEKKYYELPRGFVMQARREVGTLVLGFMREFGFNVAVSQICDAGRE